MTIVANTAGSDIGGEPVRWINATFDGWPLIISEFTSAKGLAKARPWKKGAKPGQGEPPVAIRGLNILIEWGPTTGAKPPKPDDVQQIVIAQMIAALDPLFYPLQVRSSVPIVVPVHTPVPTPSPTASPSSDPAPSPTP
jgi:hypothetical protein